MSDRLHRVLSWRGGILEIHFYDWLSDFWAGDEIFEEISEMETFPLLVIFVVERAYLDTTICLLCTFRSKQKYNISPLLH